MVVRTDWKALPMPEARELASLTRSYSQAEFFQLATGLVPQQMEDKWFMFYEEPWLFLHRSWTGFCIYQVRFEKSVEGVSIAEVVMNRDPSQHTGDFTPALLGILLDSRAGRSARSSMVSHSKGEYRE